MSDKQSAAFWYNWNYVFLFSFFFFFCFDGAVYMNEGGVAADSSSQCCFVSEAVAMRENFKS
jgi:hypothetical protein